MHQPFVHVYIPTYNAVIGKKEFFKKAITSLLSQSYPHYKIFISDDCSEDLTLECARSFQSPKIEMIQNKKKGNGVFANWNRCVAHALSSTQCDYLALFHQDDTYHPTILEQQVRFLQNNKQKKVIFTEAHYINEEDRILYSSHFPEKIKQNKASKEEIFFEVATNGNGLFICPSAMFDKSVFRDVGEFSQEYKNSSDLEMWLRILFFYKEQNPLGFIPEKLINYRLQAEQASALYELNRLEVSDFFSVIEKYKKNVNWQDSHQNAFLILKNLDLLNLELKKILLSKSLKNKKIDFDSILFFKSKSLREIKKNLGLPDFIKVFLSCIFIKPLLIKNMPDFFNRFIVSLVLSFTDPKKNILLRFILSLKNKLKQK